MTMATKTGGCRTLARLDLREHRSSTRKYPQRRLVVTGNAPVTGGSDPLHGEYIVNDANSPCK